MPQRLFAIAIAIAALLLACLGVAPPAFAAPVVVLTAPANYAKFPPPAAILISATASDSAGAIAKVEFYNGTTLLGSASAAPYTFTWNNPASGIQK